MKKKDREALRRRVEYAVVVAQNLPEWLTGGSAFVAGRLAAHLVDAEGQFFDALEKIYAGREEEE